MSDTNKIFGSSLDKTQVQYYYKPNATDGSFDVYSIVYAIGSKTSLEYNNWVCNTKTEDEAIMRIKQLGEMKNA